MYHVNPNRVAIGSRNTMSTRLPGVIEKQVEHAMFIQTQRPGRKLSDQSMTEFVDHRRVLLISCIDTSVHRDCPLLCPSKTTAGMVLPTKVSPVPCSSTSVILDPSSAHARLAAIRECDSSRRGLEGEMSPV